MGYIKQCCLDPLDPVKKGQVNVGQSERTVQSMVVDRVKIMRLVANKGFDCSKPHSIDTLYIRAPPILVHYEFAEIA
jgi:hypothetical protein